jgi:hypothetical protein
MSDYQRSTHICGFQQLRPVFKQAFRDYFKSHDMGRLDEAGLVCCQTVSHQKGSDGWRAWWDRFEKADETIYSAIVLTPDALLWTRIGEPNTPQAHVLRANLVEIRVKIVDKGGVTLAPILHDTGLEISGLVEGSNGFMRGYVGLGAGPQTEKFCQQVIEAVEKVNPRPPAGKWPSWMGGR